MEFPCQEKGNGKSKVAVASGQLQMEKNFLDPHQSLDIFYFCKI